MLANLIAGHIVRLTYATEMSTLTASEARAKLYRLIDEAAEGTCERLAAAGDN